MQIHVHVNNASYDPDGTARVTAYVYPEANEAAGHMVMLKQAYTGRWMGSTTLSGAGPWEMAIRVKRPNMEDAVTYWKLVAGGPAM